MWSEGQVRGFCLTMCIYMCTAPKQVRLRTRYENRRKSSDRYGLPFAGRARAFVQFFLISWKDNDRASVAILTSWRVFCTAMGTEVCSRTPQQ